MNPSPKHVSTTITGIREHPRQQQRVTERSQGRGETGGANGKEAITVRQVLSNSGQYFATTASGSSRPRSMARLAATAVTPFVLEKTPTIVSSIHRLPV